MHVLVVCPATVCRSRVAEVRLAEPLTRLGATVASAGVEAAAGDVLCPDASAYLHERSLALTATAPHPVTADRLADAGLILTLDREVGGVVAAMAPGARSRMFRLMWAAAAATYVAGFIAADELPPGAPAIDPSWDLTARWMWFVAELDAARGHLGARDAPGQTSFYDIDDAHVTATAHSDTLERVTAACEQFSGAAAVIVRPPAYAHS